MTARGFFLLAVAFLAGSEASSSLESAGPGSLRDDRNALVSFDRPVRRVVSLEPALTETLYVIGCFDKVAGVALSESSENWPEAVGTKAKVGSIRNVSLETVVKLEPDLVLGSFMSEKGLAGIAKLGIKTAYIAPNSCEDILKTMLVLGRVLGNEAEAERKVKEIRSRLAEAERKKPVKAKKGFFLYSVNPIMIFGAGTLPGEILALAGIENPFSRIAAAQPVVSQEEVLAADPDFLFLAMGAASSAKHLKTHPFWGRLRAVREGNVLVPRAEHYLRPSPRVLDGVEVIRSAVYGRE